MDQRRIEKYMLLYIRRSHTLLDQFERSLSSKSLYNLFDALNDDDSVSHVRIETPGGWLLTEYSKDKGILQYIRITNAWTMIRRLGTPEGLFVGHFNMYNHKFFRTRSVSLCNGKYNISQQLNTFVSHKRMVVPIGSVMVKRFNRNV